MKRAVLLILTLMLTAVSAGCVSRSDYNALEAEKTAAEEIIAEQESEIQKLTEENNNLKKSIEADTLSVNAVATAKPDDVQSGGGSVSADMGDITGNGEDISENESSYIGNGNSHKFHKPSCSYLPAEQNRVYFSSREEAVNEGYAPCKKCDP